MEDWGKGVKRKGKLYGGERESRQPNNRGEKWEKGTRQRGGIRMEGRLKGLNETEN